jgi:hypothetical protein
MMLPPPEVIASWPIPNYTDPHTRGPALLIVNLTFIAICTIMVALRMYTRVIVVRWFGWDDVFILFALVSPPIYSVYFNTNQAFVQLFSIAVNVLVVIGSTKFGWDRHLWDIPLTWISGTIYFSLLAA